MRLLLSVALLTTCAASTLSAAPPNIVLILADDLGYGDVRCYNPDGKVPTPNIDRLASAGMRFTDAHTSSSVCTPTRYGLLTGRYNWRSRLKSGVTGGLSLHLIESGRLTIASMLKEKGYATAVIGKWHLGMDWPLKAGEAAFDDKIEAGAAGWRVDYSQPITNGPNSLGFDFYFGIAASLDMVPYTFVENDRVTTIPTVTKAFPMMFNREGKETRRGPAAENFEAVQVLPTLTSKAVEYIADKSTKGSPFFLYLPLTAPHTPIAPDQAWNNRSGLNLYADFVMQVDSTVGEVLGALDRAGVADNTLVIFTSDNGCSPEANFRELAAKGHNPSGPLRGTKADIFEGGHRVPFIVRWPGNVKAGLQSAELICLNDVFATFAEIAGAKVPANAAEDSVSFLPALLGKTGNTPLREALVHHSINGSFAIRQGNWKLALCADSGGWSAPRPGAPAAQGLPPVQLYDLGNDLAERDNVAEKHPEIVDRLTALLQQYVDEGRSTPGPRQTNTGEVQIRRATPPAKRTN